MVRAARMTMIPAFLVLASIFFTSCGEPQVPLTPVKGKISVNGKALTTGNVSFRPASGNSSLLEPAGDIAEDGTYTIFTGKRQGAPVGKYFVLVTAYEPIDPNKPSATPKSLVDKKYSKIENPLLKVDVVDSPKADQYDLDLK